MQVAFFTNYIYNPHFETELELMQEHLNKGDQVLHFVCNRDLLSCDFNADHDYLKCSFCISKRKQGVALLTNKEKYTSIPISSLAGREEKKGLQLNFKSYAALKEYSYSNFEIGFASLSSLVTLLRDPEPDLRMHEDLLNKIVRTSYFIYVAISDYLSNSRIDRFYIFNGRFAINRAVLRACQAKSVKAVMHERGNDYNHYALYENVMPHAIAAFVEMVNECWNSSSYSAAEKQQVAEKYYSDRLNGKEQGWFSYTETQKKGLLPLGWNASEENIVLFNSSEDEFVAIGDEWNTDLYDSQLSIIHQLAHLQQLDGIKIWLRMHPNMGQMAKQYLKKYDVLKGTKINLIPPESLISTYDLMLAASKIVTFGSTVGIEATYWGKVSILYGKSYYKDFDVTYNPDNLQDLTDIILASNLTAKPKINTYSFGFYLSRFGVAYKIYKPHQLVGGSFKGRDLDKSFDLESWQIFSAKRGIHFFYNKLNILTRSSLNKRYV